MFTRILFCLTFLAANLLSDYLDESDEIKLLSPDDRYLFKIIFEYTLSFINRAIDFGTYLQSWAQGLELKNIYESQILPYLILPKKTVPIYYNSTRPQDLAILGGFLVFGISKSTLKQY